MTIDKLRESIKKSTKLFVEKDFDLLKLKVYEPAVSHRIAFYLEKYFFPNNIHIDCEYDKHFDQEKPGPDGKAMRPDILVHTRNSQKNNKIAIEIKKERNNKYDIEKLKIFTANKGLYKYDLGVFINFPNGEAKYRWFVDGKEESL